MKLSIITINYNNGTGLGKTISSVAGQTFKDFEYIIVDGGSTDNSVDVIKENQAAITHWVSEKDKGIYDAMNKGIAMASGEYLLMLNSGDYLVNNEILKTVFKELADKNCGIFYGDLIWETNGVHSNHSFPGKLNFNHFRQYSLGHQSAFIKKNVHDLVGLYDTGIKITADWKFFILAICKFNVSHQHFPLAVTVCGRDGISCDPVNFKQIDTEKETVLREYFPAFLPDYTTADKDSAELYKLKKIMLFKIYSKFIRLKEKLKQREQASQ